MRALFRAEISPFSIRPIGGLGSGAGRIGNSLAVALASQCWISYAEPRAM